MRSAVTSDRSSSECRCGAVQSGRPRAVTRANWSGKTACSCLVSGTEMPCGTSSFTKAACSMTSAHLSSPATPGDAAEAWRWHPVAACGTHQVLQRSETSGPTVSVSTIDKTAARNTRSSPDPLARLAPAFDGRISALADESSGPKAETWGNLRMRCRNLRSSVTPVSTEARYQ